MKLADALRTEMKAKGIGQSELARRLGVRQPTIWAWLNGSQPGARNLQRIASALGIDAGAIDLSPSHAEPHRDNTLTSRSGRRGVQQRAS